MFFPRWSFRLALAAIFLATCLEVSALNVEYCSSLNTASTNKNSSIYQSNGLCQDFCKSSYAFAVVQDDGCWCSDYVPGTTTSGCTQTCPGYPVDLCGGDGLYGYIALGNAPSGTQGGTSAAASSTQQQTSQQQSSTAASQVTTVTATPDATTVTAAAPSSPSSSSSTTSETPQTTQQLATTITPTVIHSTPSSETPSSSTWTPTPVTSLETVTGQVRTVTVTPTIPPDSQNQSSNTVSKSSGNSGLSTGGAVGLTIGLVALVGLISAIIYFCIKKRRQEKEAEQINGSRRGSSAGLGGPVPSRTMSENSRYVLGTNGRDVVERWEGDEGPPGSRQSTLLPVDPRLDPFAPVYQLSGNKSRESVNTIRDDHDYSRRVHQQGPILRATNPDI